MFDRARAVAFDLDGTVYFGDEPAPGAADVVERCRRAGRRVFFLTNNSARRREGIVRKLRAMGIPCELEEVVTAGYASAVHARERGLERVYVCGTRELEEELELQGVSTSDAEGAGNLLIGYDPDFDYGKLTLAVRAALAASSVVACNRERMYRGKGGMLFPGCGAMVAAVEWASGRGADYVVGKPNPLFLGVVRGMASCEKDELLMVGDTYESDVVMAERFGCPAVLVGEERAGVVSVNSIGALKELL